MVVTPPQEAEASQNAPPTITAWKKLPKDGDAIQAVHPVIDPSSWPTLADSSKKLLEPHSSESPSRSPTPETASPPPAKTLPESASSSSMATASTSDSDQPIKIEAPQPPQMPSHPRPSRSPSAQSQRGHHNQRFSSSSGGQRGNAFHNSNLANRRQQQARPHEWNSGRRAFVPRSFNQNQQHYQYQPQGFGMQPAPMPIPPYPNTATGTVPLYFAPPVQPPVVGYMLPYGYYGEQPFQDVYRPVYSSPSPYPDSIRAGGIPNLQLPGYTPQEDTDVCNALLAQIEYYFSDVNLETDDYLKGQMDEQGWVSVHLISGFKRIVFLTTMARVGYGDPVVVIILLRKQKFKQKAIKTVGKRKKVLE
ncbi:hypothetical protein ACLOJK_014065 [Asimina triloba]